MCSLQNTSETQSKAHKDNLNFLMLSFHIHLWFGWNKSSVRRLYLSARLLDLSPVPACRILLSLKSYTLSEML